jgi:hypothetical protein
MTTLGEAVPASTVPAVETYAEPEPRTHRVRRALGMAAAALTFGVIGAGAGLAIAANHETDLEIAGTPAQIETTTNTYNELSIDNNVLTLQIPASGNQKVLGQPVGVHLNLDVDISQFMGKDGKLNTPALTAYGTLFGDLKQIETDATSALLRHDGEGAGLGALVGIALYGARRGRKSWQEHQDLLHPEDATAARRHNEPLQTFRRRTAIVLAVAGAVSTLPASTAHAPKPAVIQADIAFNDTPLEGAQIDGALAPIVRFGENFIAKEITDINTSYDTLAKNQDNYLQTNPIELPTGPEVRNLLFVTDRHCNDGMDRVIVRLAQRLGVPTIVSGGDDAFSGSFSFESGCTSDIAERAK